MLFTPTGLQEKDLQIALSNFKQAMSDLDEVWSSSREADDELGKIMDSNYPFDTDFEYMLVSGTRWADSCISQLQGGPFIPFPKVEEGPMFLIKDNSGRGYKVVQSISFIKEHWENENEDDENEESFYYWLDNAEVGDISIHHESNNTFERLP